MSRRFALILMALTTTLAVVLSACAAQAPAAPLLSDPKEILTETVVSLKDLKTVEFTGAFTGSVEAAELGGSLDLSSVTMTGALDVPNKKAKFSLDAPSVLGTKIEAMMLADAAYYKVSGLLAGMLGATADKYTKVDVPESSGEPVTDPAEIAKMVDEIKDALDELPTAPTKGADEKCGDQTCYHVTITATADELKELDPTGGAAGDVTFDIWTRQNDRLPAKLSLSVDSPDIGTIGMTLEFRYGVSVSVEAPAAGDIAP